MRGYIAVMEDRAEIQDRRIEEMDNHNHTMKIPVTNTAAASTIIESSDRRSSSRSNSSKLDLHFSDMKAAIQKMAKTVSSQETSVAALTKHVAKHGGGGSRTNGGGGGCTNGGG